MSTLLTLPNKIICDILQVLGRSNMFPFLTVNKQLHLIAIEEFYKGLILNQGHLELFELNFLPRDPTDNASFRKHHHYIKEVNLSRLQPTKIVDTDRFFFVGIFFFPSLTTIDVSNDFRKSSVLEYLLYFVDPNILPHLQKIKAFKTGTHANEKTTRIIKSLYMCVCFRFRDSLTHFELLEPYENYTLHTKGTYRSHLDLLPFFKKVTHLVLYCQLQDEQVDRLITSTVISACPDLIDFQIVCNSEYKEKPDDGTYAKEDYPTIKRVIRNIIDTAEDVPIHLKNVSLELRTMNTVCMNSILNNIPTSQLDKFKLSLTCKQELIDWVANTPTDTIKEFFQHVKLAKESTITSQYAYPLLTPKETIQATVYPVRKLWAISNALTQSDSKIILQIHFSKAEIENALFYTFELENSILKIFQVVGEKNFFSGNYSYLQMVPFYDHVFGEAIDEMTIVLSDKDLGLRCRYLLEHYSHVKKLNVTVKGGTSLLKLCVRKKPMASIPHDPKQRGIYPVKNHHSPVDIEINRKLLAIVKMNHLFIDSLIIDSFKITKLPIGSGKYKLKFGLKTQFKHLILDLKMFQKIKEPVPFLVTLINQVDRTKSELKFLANLEHRTITHSPGSFGSTDTKIYKARLEFLHKGCEEVSICYRGQVIYNKSDTQMDRV